MALWLGVERCDAAQVGVTETVLVAYASGNGSTKEIAEFIAARLIRNGLLVQAHSVVDAPDPAAFEAVVIGSAIHNRAWLPSTEEYVRRFRAALATQNRATSEPYPR